MLKKAFTIIVLLLSIAYVLGRIAVNANRSRGGSPAAAKPTINAKYLPAFDQTYTWGMSCAGEEFLWEIYFSAKEKDGGFVVVSPTDEIKGDTFLFSYYLPASDQVNLKFKPITDSCPACSCGMYEQFGHKMMHRKLSIANVETADGPRKIYELEGMKRKDALPEELENK